MLSSRACSPVELGIAVLSASGTRLRLPVSRSRLSEVVGYLLNDIIQHPVEVSFCFCDDETIRHYNASYRHVDEPTDVLSFPLLPMTDDRFPISDGFPMDERAIHLGDVMISVEAARRQASRNGLSLETEVLMLALHGVLHLVGYEDETEEGREEMNRIAVQVLRNFGYRIEEDWFSYHYDERAG